MATELQSEFQGQVRSRSMEQKANEFTLVPYVEVNGQRILPDSFLVEVFEQMEDEDLVDTVFHSGSVKHQFDFIAMMKNPANLPLFVINRDNKCVMVAWLNAVSHTHASGHFCYFKSIGGIDPVEAGNRIVDYWFSLRG